MIWNSIKGALFVEDPAAPAAKTAAPTPAEAPSTTLGATPAGAPSSQSGVNAEFVAAIKKAVFGKQTALTALVTAADSLAEIIPDPTTRFKAAFKTSSAGRTVQQIASAADIHLADVEGEELRFKAAVEQKLGTEITQLESTATNAAAQITALQHQLEEAQKRITQLMQQQAESTALASQKKIELQTVSDQFKAAAQTVRNEIQSLRQAVLTALS